MRSEEMKAFIFVFTRTDLSHAVDRDISLFRVHTTLQNDISLHLKFPHCLELKISPKSLNIHTDHHAFSKIPPPHLTEDPPKCII